MNDPSQAREFAVSVVQKLHDAGYEALWAGGCVRDQRLGRQPKDYDVASSATPDQIRDVFGRKRTLAIGAAFGVITVLGSKQEGQIEIATFRRDAEYSDGRHPDHVTFSSAEEDAKRRDFTINGLFHDPLTGQDIDHVNGGEDLRRRLIRAIGNPHDRVAEDKLRMLRAVRFAATFDFAIEEETMAAVCEHARELVIVSAERIADELRRMLEHPARRKAVELLATTGLLAVIIPEFAEGTMPAESTLQIIERLHGPTFSVAAAVLLRDVVSSTDDLHGVANVCRRLRLSNEETAGILLCLQHEALLRSANQNDWPRVQRVLTSKRIGELLAYLTAVSDVLDEEPAGLTFCRDKLSLPAEQWNPAPLITGDDLKVAGLQPGPHFRLILDAIRDRQLIGEITDKSEALDEAKRLSALGGQ